MNSVAQVFGLALCLSALLPGVVGQTGDVPCITGLGQCIHQYNKAFSQGVNNIGAIGNLCRTHPQIKDCLAQLEGDDTCKKSIRAVQRSMDDLLVETKICERTDEIKKYSACFSKPEIMTSAGCEPKTQSCAALEAQTRCMTAKVREACGEKQSEIMDLVSRGIARNIAKTLKMACPGLDSSGDKFVPLSVVVVSILALLAGAFTMN